jgi:GTP-binding protein EngB required for normal cell division
MGNSSNSSKKTKDNQNDDFNDASLDIYLFGQYNPIMEIIIGEMTEERKGYEDYVNMPGYEFIENIENREYISIGQTPMDEETKINTLKERIIKNNDNLIEKNNFEINFDKFLGGFKNHKNKIMSEEPYQVKHPVFKWNLNFYCKESLNCDSLSKVKDNFEQHFYDEQKNILIVFIDNIKTIFKVIDIFSVIHSENHPLFLFIINRKETISNISVKMDNYLKLKKVKHFNMRNVTLLEEVDLCETPTEENSYYLNKKKSDYIVGLYSFLINSWFYYNNLGDNFEFAKNLGKYSNRFLEDINNEKQDININSHVGLFNIIVLGKPGTGKSTLINVLSKNKRSLEGRGASGTKKIIKYNIKDYNISLYDTPGFELDKDIDKTKKFINNLQKNLRQGKHQINMAFYLISGGARDFYENEKIILKTLMENNIPTFFLLTFSPNLEKGNEFKEIVEMSLRRTFKKFDKDKGMKYYKQQVKVFAVHLLDENDDSCRNFGIKTFMEAAFERFKYCIVEDNELEMLDNIINDYQKENYDDKPNRVKEIFNLFEGKEIYKYFKEIDDVLTSSINQSNSVISKYSLIGMGASFLLNLLLVLPVFFLKFIKERLLNEILNIFKKDINDEEREKYLSGNLEEKKIVNNFPLISSYYNYNYIHKVGEGYVKVFTEELKSAGIEGLSIFIKKFIKSYNNAIYGLKEIAQNFNE